MANEANIKAVITADDRASGVLRGFGDNVSGVASKVGSALKIAAEGLAVGAAAATAFGVSSVKAYSESQDILAQLNTVLKSTGNVAGWTADNAIKLSKALQSDTKYSDEAVLSVENLLLTFTAIGSKIMPRATETVLDMATALGEDTKSASIQLGKALQDPVLGITALRRVGVNFSNDQKDVIAKLVETGQKAKAQQLILKELNVEFGGSARAAGQTFSGSLEMLKNSFNDVQEVIGQTIVKHLGPFISKAAQAIASIDWEKVINNSIAALKRFITILDDVWQRIDKVYQQVEHYLQPKLEALWHTVENNLIPTLSRLWHEVLEPLVPVIGVTLVIALGLVIDALNVAIKVVVGLTNFFLDHKTAVIAVATAFGVLVGAMAINASINAVIVGFNTLTLITIPSLIATLSALGTAFLAAMPVIAVAVAVAAIVAAIMTIKDAWDAVNAAERSAQNLDNAATEDQIRNLQKQAAAARAVGDTKKAGQIANAIGALTGGRAAGGPIIAGGAYLVGEKGPEVIVPNQNGTVIPNNKLGNSTINININAGALMGNDVEARKFAQIIQKHLQDAQNMKGMAVA